MSLEGYVLLLAMLIPILILIFAFASHKIFERLGICGILNTILSFVISLSIVHAIVYETICFLTYEKRVKNRALHDVVYYVKEYKIKENHDEHKQCFEEYKQSNQTFRDFDIFSCVERKVMIKTEKEKLRQLNQ